MTITASAYTRRRFHAMLPWPGPRRALHFSGSYSAVTVKVKRFGLSARAIRAHFFWIAFAEAGEVNHALAYDISAGIVRLSLRKLFKQRSDIRSLSYQRLCPVNEIPERAFVGNCGVLWLWSVRDNTYPVACGLGK